MVCMERTYFPGGPMVKTSPSNTQPRHWFWRSHMPLGQKKQNIKQKQSYNKVNKDFISGPQKSHRKSFENMSWVFTAGQACSRHLGPNMGKNKSLFPGQTSQPGVLPVATDSWNFSHLSSFCSRGECPSCQVTFLALWGFFSDTLCPFILWNLWALGVWKTQPEKTQGYFCRLPCHILPELVLWFKGRRRKKEM